MRKTSGIIYIRKKHFIIAAVCAAGISGFLYGWPDEPPSYVSSVEVTEETEEKEKPDYIKWVELLAVLGAKYGGDFGNYKPSDMEKTAKMFTEDGKTSEDFVKDMKYYDYYRKAYGAVLDGMVGEFESGGKKQYSLKAYHPIAKSFPYSDYDDFGVSRSYGYRRNHLGHDMMGQVGTPVIAVESGYVKEPGWNQYGGWRIGINSFDGKRYYYYAHLRQDFPFAKWIKKGSVVQAGDNKTKEWRRTDDFTDPAVKEYQKKE